MVQWSSCIASEHKVTSSRLDSFFFASQERQKKFFVFSLSPTLSRCLSLSLSLSLSLTHAHTHTLTLSLAHTRSRSNTHIHPHMLSSAPAHTHQFTQPANLLSHTSFFFLRHSHVLTSSLLSRSLWFTLFLTHACTTTHPTAHTKGMECAAYPVVCWSLAHSNSVWFYFIGRSLGWTHCECLCQNVFQCQILSSSNQWRLYY